MISGKDTLDDLCEFILESFNFIHEHLYEFCMDNRMYSEDSYQYEPEDGGPSTDVAIDKIGYDEWDEEDGEKIEWWW